MLQTRVPFIAIALAQRGLCLIKAQALDRLCAVKIDRCNTPVYIFNKSEYHYIVVTLLCDNVKKSMVEGASGLQTS